MARCPALRRPSFRRGAGLLLAASALLLSPAGVAPGVVQGATPLPAAAPGSVRAQPPAPDRHLGAQRSLVLRSVPLPAPSPAADGSGAPGVDEGQPTDAEVNAANETAAAAHAEVDRQAGRLAAAEAQLRHATAAAGLALERYHLAVLALLRAQLAVNQAEDRLERASAELRAGQEALAGWVRQAYGAGDQFDASPAAASLLSGTSLDELDLTVVVLNRAGVAAQRTLARVERAQTAQQAAADAADAAQRAAQASAVRAATLRAEADASVTAQQALVDQVRGDLAGSRDAAADADGRAERLARARALAEARTREWRNRVTGEVGSCAGGDTSLYPNGQIPLTALCPLWGAPGEHLRADAAFAFGRLSQAYAADTGLPLCVTDSYRPYAEQVQVYAAKPHLAAVPGTSNHGWGTAVDLCGGVESFGTAAHEWMSRNAPAFGWFHPAWAEPSGSRPEAWHWEFAG